MQSWSTYVPGNSFVHRLDARVKLVLLLAFSITVFCVQHWTALGVLALVVAAAIADARLSWRRFGLLALPLLVIMLIVWVCNAFMLDVSAPASSALSSVSAGFATGWKPVVLWGSFGFSPQGCMFALFYAVRIYLILFASFVVTFTATSTQLSEAFISFLNPLRRLGVPVDDAATILSLALRFIPLIAEELAAIKRAQVSRGTQFDTGGAWQRISAYLAVFTPLLIGLFRRANVLACAMDARCYGAGPRTSLNEAMLTAPQVGTLVVGLAACVMLALAL